MNMPTSAQIIGAIIGVLIITFTGGTAIFGTVMVLSAWFRPLTFAREMRRRWESPLMMKWWFSGHVRAFVWCVRVGGLVFLAISIFVFLVVVRGVLRV